MSWFDLSWHNRAMIRRTENNSAMMTTMMMTMMTMMTTMIMHEVFIMPSRGIAIFSQPWWALTEYDFILFLICMLVLMTADVVCITILNNKYYSLRMSELWGKKCSISLLTLNSSLVASLLFLFRLEHILEIAQLWNKQILHNPCFSLQYFSPFLNKS